MGGSVGGLERLHHLFLPGCRRFVQGETLKCQYFVLIWLYSVEFEIQISLSVHIDFNIKFQEDFLIFLLTANGPFYHASRNAQAVIVVITYSFLSWIQSKYPDLLWPSLLSSPCPISPHHWWNFPKLFHLTLRKMNSCSQHSSRTSPGVMNFQNIFPSSDDFATLWHTSPMWQPVTTYVRVRRLCVFVRDPC